MGVEIVTPGGGAGGGGGGGGGAGSDTTAVHSGDAAGGDLAGTYPSPTIGASKVVTNSIAANAVTLAKIATIADATILGNNSGGASVPIALTVAQVKTLLGIVAVATSGSASDLSAGTLAAARMPALTGDVTTSAGAVATTIAAAAVTYAKIQNVSATSRVLGRISSGAGTIEELTAANLKTILALVAGDITDGVFIPFRFRFGLILATTTGVYREYNDTGRTLTIVSTRITLGTVNTGASVLVDVNVDGTTIFTTQANRPAIAASASPATSKNTNMDVTTIANGSYFSVDIDQIGSTIPGSDLMVEIWCKG